MKKLLVLLALSVTAQTFAYYPGWCGPPPGARERFSRQHPCCGQNRNCCPQPTRPRYFWQSRLGGRLEIGADALYWRSTRPGIVTWSRTNSGIQNVNELNPNYDWGGRIFGNVKLPACGWAIGGGYLYLRNSGFSSHRDSEITIPNLNLGDNATITEAQAARRFWYQLAHLIGSYDICERGCSRVYVYGGGFWADILEKQKIKANGLDDTTAVEGNITTRYRLQGGGIMLGIGGQYNFTQGLYGVTRFGGLGLIGQRQTRWDSRAPLAVFPDGGRFRANYPSHWGIIPGIQYSLAVRYTLNICGLALSGEIGYEIHYYFEAIRRVPFQPDNPDTIYADAGFAGPFAGLRLEF